MPRLQGGLLVAALLLAACQGLGAQEAREGSVVTLDITSDGSGW